MLAFYGGSRVRLPPGPEKAVLGQFWPGFAARFRGPDFPAGEGRKGLPLGQAERVAVRPARREPGSSPDPLQKGERYAKQQKTSGNSDHSPY